MSKEPDREAFRQKNARRKAHKSRTNHAAQGKEMRRLVNGAFGKTAPSVYNTCAEGTTAVRKAEHDLKDEA